jgi:hypothetical protein
MSRFQLVILGLVAMLVLGAVVLAPAGAEEPKKCGVSSPTHWAYCYSSKEEIGNPVQKATGTGGVSLLAGTIGAAEAKFECKEVALVSELESSGKGKGSITLSKCKETKPLHCKLSAAEEKEILISFKEALFGKLETPGSPEVEFSGAGAGEEIGQLEIEHETSECGIVPGNYKVTGKQDAQLPVAEELHVEHEVVAKKSGSNFKIGENEASLSTTLKVKLSSPHEGAPWYIGLGT